MDGKSGRMKRNDPRLGYINRFVDDNTELNPGTKIDNFGACVDYGIVTVTQLAFKWCDTYS